MIKTNLYQKAVTSVLTVAQKTQAVLDQAAVTARNNNQAAIIAAATEGVDSESPLYPIATLVAQTITVGREDGYPSVSIPDEIFAVIKAAYQSGMVEKKNGYLCVGKIQFYTDGGVHSTQCSEHDLDFQAWNKAANYRNAQTVYRL